jgi:pseudouridine-5'-phosphate glycosidase
MAHLLPFDLHVHPEIEAAVTDGVPVVALETTIISHGLPYPQNLDVALACEAAVRDGGAVPATIGVVDGTVTVGLSRAQLERFADPASSIRKVSARDLGMVIAQGLTGATTVAGTLAVAGFAGITVMATGGLGGVHRGASETFDESADLVALGRRRHIVVAAGVKSILDIGATLERLDTLGVAVVGMGVDRFPGFYRRETPFRVDWSTDSVTDIAAAARGHFAFNHSSLLVANPIPHEAELPLDLHDAALAEGLRRVAEGGITGQAVTPVLLSAFAEYTAGQSVTANAILVEHNCRVAGQIASAYGVE